MPSPAPTILDLLTRFSRGELSIDGAALQLAAINSSDQAVAMLDGATVDLGRATRCGFGEVVYGEGKPAELIGDIAERQLLAGEQVLITRIDATAAAQVRRRFPASRFNPLARTLCIGNGPCDTPYPLDESDLASRPHAAVVTAGSTDRPIAEEAIETLAWMGVPYQRIEDIGVAGPQRLLLALPRLRLASAVIVIAGMEGALPAVVAGHLAVPVIAVPTSVGYGVNLGGLTTLLGMLNSCAASVAVVNIDAGFKGGYVAGMIVRQLERLTANMTSGPKPPPPSQESCDHGQA